MSAVANPQLDPYSAKAERTDVTPQQKITDLHGILKATKTCMLTTRSADGQLHARAMAPTAPKTATQLNLIFIANNVSHKFEELQNDTHVNVSFCDTSSTSWASFSGIAKISQDKALIKEHWNPIVSAYFGDLKDGVHKGDAEDPRVAVIEVIPDEIRYWLATQGTVTRAVTTAVSAATGHATAPGELRTITKAEIQLVDGLHTK